MADETTNTDRSERPEADNDGTDKGPEKPIVYQSDHGIEPVMNSNQKKSDDPIPPSDSKKETPDLQANTKMEVHHHPQLEHKPKPWKEYLLEGMMIFVAVMMGFIAENIRENIVNREHVGDLVSRLVQDLKADTLQINEIYQEESKIYQANDSLVSLLNRPLEKPDNGRLVTLVVAAHSMWPFHASAGAIGAIKNELHLRQFSNSEIIGYISQYEKHIELLHTVQDITLQYQRNFIDPFLLNHVSATSLEAAFNKAPLPDPEMRNLSRESLTELAADMVLIRINTGEVLLDNRKVKNDAVQLLAYLKERYHPDAE